MISGRIAPLPIVAGQGRIAPLTGDRHHSEVPLSPPVPSGPGGAPPGDPLVYTRGEGGGPAEPTGPVGKTKEDKEALEDGQFAFTTMANAAEGLAILTALTGDLEMAVYAGLAYVILSETAAGISRAIDDPPQLDYRRAVHIEATKVKPVTGVYQPLFRFCQVLEETTVLANAWTDAVERYQGAKQANDYDWVVTHMWVAWGLRKSFWLHAARISPTAKWAANAIVGTPVDVDLSGNQNPSISGKFSEHLLRFSEHLKHFSDRKCD